MKTIQEHFPDLYPKYEKLYSNNDKYGNLDRRIFEELNLIWPEIRGYKYGYELGLDYTAERYVPEGCIDSNLKTAALFHRLAYLKSFFIKGSQYEIKQLNKGASLLNEFDKDISSFSSKQLENIGLDKVVIPYIKDYLEGYKSNLLEKLEEEAYNSVSRYLKSKEKVL
jgi:hypothetical protein